MSSIAICITAILFVFAITPANGQANGFCSLQFNDEFNGAALDTSFWQIEETCSGNGNNELECYTARPKNVFLDQGQLVLAAFRETYTGTQAGCTGSDGCTNTQPYTSGRINSSPTARGAFLHGRMEIRAKLTSGSHLWPAIWMLPQDWAYGGWAASGEIDIMEQRGDNPTQIGGTLHHGGAWPNNVYTTTGDHSFNNQDLSQDYHVYGVEWSPETMNWFVDNTTFQSYPMNQWWNTSVSINPYSAMGQPWDKSFHFVFNVAVGGNFFNGYPAMTDAMAAAWKVAEMRIDYVRVWNQGGDCAQAQALAATLASNGTLSTTSSSVASTSTTKTVPSSSTTSTVAKPSQTDVNDLQGSQSDVQAPSEHTLDGKTVLIISASIGGAALLLGVAGIIIGVVLIVKARRNLMVPNLTPSGSQEKMLPYSV